MALVATDPDTKKIKELRDKAEELGIEFILYSNDPSKLEDIISGMSLKKETLKKKGIEYKTLPGFHVTDESILNILYNAKVKVRTSTMLENLRQLGQYQHAGPANFYFRLGYLENQNLIKRERISKKLSYCELTDKGKELFF